MLSHRSCSVRSRCFLPELDYRTYLTLTLYLTVAHLAADRLHVRCWAQPGVDAAVVAKLKATQEGCKNLETLVSNKEKPKKATMWAGNVTPKAEVPLKVASGQRRASLTTALIEATLNRASRTSSRARSRASSRASQAGRALRNSFFIRSVANGSGPASRMTQLFDADVDAADTDSSNQGKDKAKVVVKPRKGRPA